MYRAVGAEHQNAYYALTGAGMSCFLLSQALVKRPSARWAATLLHGGVHVLGNAGNIALYSGAIAGTGAAALGAAGAAAATAAAA